MYCSATKLAYRKVKNQSQEIDVQSWEKLTKEIIQLELIKSDWIDWMVHVSKHKHTGKKLRKRHRLVSFKALWSCTETVIWTLNRLVPNEVHYMEKILEYFHQKPTFLFDWRKKEIDILDDMGVSKLSAKVFFLLCELLL